MLVKIMLLFMLCGHRIQEVNIQNLRLRYLQMELCMLNHQYILVNILRYMIHPRIL